MQFNSIHFLMFLPVVVLAYFALPLRWRKPLLLLASYYFYWVFSVPLSLLLVASTLLDYGAALAIAASTRKAVRRAALLASIIGNLGLLGTFKYLGFVNDTLTVLFGATPWPAVHLILPIGISFYTFQTMSYTIDVYRGHLTPTRSLLDFALYVSFFPQLVAGPIMRGATLLPQFNEHHHPHAARMLSGACLIVWGLLKKALVADPMGRIADTVYGHAAAFSGAALLLGTYAFALQIYCDFSAYTDIARGAGRVMGYRISMNFRAPYLAVSFSDFWRRWHITLSTWLRDYLYMPLGGNRRGERRTYVNLLLVMALGGLWHGAGWTFVCWGLLHGVYLAVERWLGLRVTDAAELSPAQRWLRRTVVLHLVCIGWVLFRAPSLSAAGDILWRIITWADGAAMSTAPLWGLAALLLWQASGQRPRLAEVFMHHPRPARWVVYAGVALLVMVFSASRPPEFIYFQF